MRELCERIVQVAGPERHGRFLSCERGLDGVGPGHQDVRNGRRAGTEAKASANASASASAAERCDWGGHGGSDKALLLVERSAGSRERRQSWCRVAVALVRVQVAPVDRTELALRTLVPATRIRGEKSDRYIILS